MKARLLKWDFVFKEKKQRRVWMLENFSLPVLEVEGSLDTQWLHQALKLYPPDSNERSSLDDNSNSLIKR